MPSPIFVPAGKRYPDLAAEKDYFIAIDGETQIGMVRLIEDGPETGRWQWGMYLVRPGPTFKLPTDGTAGSKAEAVGKLVDCYGAFRAWYRLE